MTVPSVCLDIVKDSLLGEEPWALGGQNDRLSIQVVQESLRLVIADYERLLAEWLLTQDDGK
jgi:hypothetical protein